jgi:hypothetical protein
MTCSNSLALSFDAISLALCSWSSKTAAMMVSDTLSAAAHRTDSVCRTTPKRFAMAQQHIVLERGAHQRTAW